MWQWKEGGGWQESCHELAPVFDRSNSFSHESRKVSIEGIEEIKKQNSSQDFSVSPSPIWGDHVRSIKDMSDKDFSATPSPIWRDHVRNPSIKETKDNKSLQIPED